MSMQDVLLITTRRYLVSAHFCTGGDSWQEAGRGKLSSPVFRVSFFCWL